MARATRQSKKVRKQYSAEYKTEALALAARVGVSGAAQQLGLHESQLYAWRGKVKREQSQSEAERQLGAENARLKRQLAEQAEELAISKKCGGVLREGLEVRYAVMDTASAEGRETAHPPLA